jgi:hypothetical protein
MRFSSGKDWQLISNRTMLWFRMAKNTRIDVLAFKTLRIRWQVNCLKSPDLADESGYACLRLDFLASAVIDFISFEAPPHFQ